MSWNPFYLISAIFRFYRDGFRNMTWGKVLWAVILLKLFILFVVLRLFFFKPAMSGKTDEQKSEIVGNAITRPNLINNTKTE
ncbi:MAG: DUF4492 domain-containing protein [Bacteroidales bacterium]|nr:DUF4492 domain-containing protein [Bacteroidales bacterium]